MSACRASVGLFIGETWRTAGHMPVGREVAGFACTCTCGTNRIVEAASDVSRLSLLCDDHCHHVVVRKNQVGPHQEAGTDCAVDGAFNATDATLEGRHF